jgi:creatinine amidohydrolase/Fe(II)-dependent formamide hydrolase-like protein
MHNRKSKRNAGVLDSERLKETGPFNKMNRTAFIYSIGASNEGHGRALPSNIDDHIAIYTATAISRKGGYNYRCHIPYSSDRVGPIARDWNPAYISMDELVGKLTRDLRRDIKNLQINGDLASHVVLVSGHGGNNFLKEREHEISKEIGQPFLYAPPFANVQVTLNGHGNVELWHADHGEHSVGLFLGLLDSKKLNEINRVAKADPIEALRRDPPIMGLGFYVLPELSGDNKYGALRTFGDSVTKKFIEHDRMIIADHDVGRRFMEGNIESTWKQIADFIRK